MSYPHRLIIIVPAAAKQMADAAAAAVEPDQSCTGPWFSVALSASGQEPATHWALYTSATDDMVSAMASALPQITGAMFWRHDLNDVLVASNVTEPAGQAWGWQQSLAAAGLAVVQSPLP